MKRKVVKRRNIIQLFLTVAIIILVNYIGSYIFTRFDLTSEKRYTLSLATKELLENLEDVVYIQIYLEGDLPVGFKRLRNATKELLDEFRIYTKNIEYEFINVFESNDEKTEYEIGRQLMKKGLMPVNLQEKDKEGKVSQKIIFPGAIINYREKELAIELLKNNPGISPQAKLNNSIEDLEYELTNAIRKLTTKVFQKIAFIEGHGELDEYEAGDISNALSEFYYVERIKIAEQLNSLNDYSVIIIAKPDSIFSEKDKFIIDRFIMKGGKVLWFIDAVKANMDSLAYSNATIATINSVNIEDQLFTYGVRINNNLIQDIQCAEIPVNTAIVGAPPQFVPRPWFYFPLIIPQSNHPVTKNLNIIKTEFVSVIDTVGNDSDIKKTFLLKTSKYSKVINAPVKIGLDIIHRNPEPQEFNKSYLPIAVLLEGKFESVFKNRLTPEIEQSKEIGFKKKSIDTKMIVVSDGNIIKNFVRILGDKKYPLPLGADKYYSDIFYPGNKEFILNAVNYLCDDSGLMSIRSRELKLRLLDRAKIEQQRFKLQLINIVLPVIFIILFGFLVSFIRKRKYSF